MYFKSSRTFYYLILDIHKSIPRYLQPLPNRSLADDASGIQVIQDPYNIEQVYNKLVRSAKREILLFLPTTSAFLREEKIGIIQSLKDASSRGVKVRILTPTDEKIEPKAQALFQDIAGEIQLRRILHKPDFQDSQQARTKILIIDRREYLLVELKDDSKETFVDAVLAAIYSSTLSTVKSYLTLFESLWEQTEFYDQLESHEKMQREFINVAAHELRTPMQPIIGLVEVLRSEYKDGRDKIELEKNDFDVLFRNAMRLERLATDILEASRIESNTFRLNKEVFDLNEKIKNVLRDFEMLRHPSTKVQIVAPTGMPILIKADKNRLFEVLSNLIRNAIKFTQEGMITVVAEKHSNYAQVEIRDTGSGIDPEIMPKLFQKFATKSGEGTGLGLYLARKIIEAHGGEIWARNNEDGKGAVFAFTLPVEQELT